MSATKETRQYKKRDDAEDVKRWCALYPWYRKVVDDIHATLAARDSHCGDYRLARSGRPNRMNAA